MKRLTYNPRNETWTCSSGKNKAVIAKGVIIGSDWDDQYPSDFQTDNRYVFDGEFAPGGVEQTYKDAETIQRNRLKYIIDSYDGKRNVLITTKSIELFLKTCRDRR